MIIITLCIIHEILLENNAIVSNKQSNIDIKIKDIYDIHKNKKFVSNIFEKCIKGYHLINSSHINETIWEEVNAMIFLSLKIDIYSKSNNNHLSGMDIDCSLGKISNKSAKYSNNKKSFNISSYRLTTICSDKKCGTPTEIINEINKRKNFNYYSIIVRNEIDNENVGYDWILIPSDYLILHP